MDKKRGRRAGAAHVDVTEVLCDAAKERDMKLVRSLMRVGAEVNAVSREGRTTLLEACMHGRFEVVHYLVSNGADVSAVERDTGDSCLLITMRLELDAARWRTVDYLKMHGADFNHTNLKGDTALHKLLRFDESATIAQPLHNLYMMRLMNRLYASVAYLVKNSEGFTPLQLAAAQRNHEVVELLIAQRVIHGEERSCTIAERIDALLLLGAACLLSPPHAQRTRSYWRRAMDELETNRKNFGKRMVYQELLLSNRNEEGNLELLMNKNCSCNQCDAFNRRGVKRSAAEAELENNAILPGLPPVVPNAVYGYAVEVNSVAELEALTPDGQWMQALLVLERILGPAHKQTLHHVDLLGARWSNDGDVDRALALWTHALESARRCLKPYSDPTRRIFENLLQLFSKMLNAGGKLQMPQLNKILSEMTDVFDRAVQELERGGSVIDTWIAFPDRDVELIVQFIALIRHAALQLDPASAPRIMSPARSEDARSESDTGLQCLKAALGRLVKLGVKDRTGRTMLHLACGQLSTPGCAAVPNCAFPNPGVVAALLEAGLDVNASDLKENTPLHAAAEYLKAFKDRGDGKDGKEAVEVMTMLVQRGADTDARNAKRRTPRELLAQARLSHDVRLSVDDIFGTSM